VIDTLRNLLRPLLARRHSPAERRALAEALRHLADDQERIAAADETLGPALRRAQMDAAPRTSKGGRPKGSGARFVRWDPPQVSASGERRSGHLHIGRALWQELGEPTRMNVQRLGAELHLRPCGPGEGWAVTKPINGMPRLNVGEEPATALRLVEGRHDAVIRAGAIVART
jgi:hypothetical protein